MREKRFKGYPSLDPKSIRRIVYTKTLRDAEAMQYVLAELAIDSEVVPVSDDLKPGAVAYGFKYSVRVLPSRS